jgi:hypothetical protein
MTYTCTPFNQFLHVMSCIAVGAVIGLLGVCLVLGMTYVLDLPDSIIGWTPYIFLSVVVMGFAPGKVASWVCKNKLSLQTI